MRKAIDIAGQRFGKLTVIKAAGYSIKGNAMWECLCDCGNVRDIKSYNLRKGLSKSCGCVRITHNMTNTPTYSIWSGMRQRCNNIKGDKYHYYGGRGIAVCGSWLKFENFFKDMGECPKGLTLERIDNSKGYSPDNCKWATRSEQNRNQRLKKTNKTGVSGVFWNKKNQKYQVAIKKNYKQHYIGQFVSLEQAFNARKEAEQKYWGK